VGDSKSYYCISSFKGHGSNFRARVGWSIVSDEKTFSKVPPFVDRRDFNYPVFYGSKEDAEKYYVQGVPEYVIIDKEGIIRMAVAGYSKNIEIELNKLLLK